MKILIVTPAWLGDMVMSHSLIQVLKGQHPDAEFAVLAPKSTLPISELMPEFTIRFVVEDGHGQFNLKRRWQLAREIRTHRFDAAYILPNTLKSALIPFLARIPRRVGWLGESRYLFLNEIHKNPPKLPLMVERYVALAYPQNQFLMGSEFPCPRLIIPADLSAQTIEKFGIDTRKQIFTLSPGAAFGPAKKWPAEYFAQVAQAKINEGYEVWMIGAPNEKEAAAEIISIEPCVRNFVGETSLLEMVTLLSLSQQVLTNDSGPMHIAASLSVPLVAIFGSSSPDFTPPLGEKVCILEKNDLSCRPCFQRTCRFGHYACLREIMPSRVLEALKAT